MRRNAFLGGEMDGIEFYDSETFVFVPGVWINVFAGKSRSLYVFGVHLICGLNEVRYYYFFV